MDQKLQRGTAASRPLVFRQAADATIPGPHPHCEGKNDRCLTTISSEPATSKKAPSVRSSTSYYTLCVCGWCRRGVLSQCPSSRSSASTTRRTYCGVASSSPGTPSASLRTLPAYRASAPRAVHFSAYSERLPWLRNPPV